MKLNLFCLLPILLVVMGSSVSLRAEPKLSQAQTIRVELRDPSGAADEIMIRVKEQESGKVTQLTLDKDPSIPHVWSGYFMIQFFKGDNSTKTLDFQTQTGVSFFANITQERSLQKVMLFKTSEELTLFEAAQVEEEQKDEVKKTSNQITKQILVAKPKGKETTPVSKAKIEQLVRKQGQINETAQLSLEEAQTKKRLALLEQQQKLSEELKKKKIEQAASLVKQADALYAKQNYKEAEKLYAEATELDPGSEAYFYRYGVSLYKMANYNKSLAVLALATVGPDLAVEKDYYVALNHLKLKDYDKALKGLTDVRDENDPNLSPIASFFAGNIELQQQKFPAARKSMEYVIDNSKDPKLDRSAENLLEQIDRLESYYESKKEKYRLRAFGGILYDTNILNVAENNVSTDVKSWRLNYGASALAILHRTPKSDLGAQLSVSDYYSVNSGFKSDADIQSADALDIGITLPYHHEIALSKNQMNLEVIPGYKNIIMSTSGGNRKVVVRSTELNTTLSAPIKGDLYLSTRLDLGADQSLLETSTGDDDLSGSRYGITFNPIKILDLKGEKTLSTELGYLINNTKGKNNRYQRPSLALSYGFPAFSKGSGMLRADYSQQDYREADEARKDTSLGLTASYSKDLNRKWNMALSVQMTNANSDVEAYKYNKFLITGLFTYTHSILQK